MCVEMTPDSNVYHQQQGKVEVCTSNCVGGYFHK